MKKLGKKLLFPLFIVFSATLLLLGIFNTANVGAQAEGDFYKITLRYRDGDIKIESSKIIKSKENVLGLNHEGGFSTEIYFNEGSKKKIYFDFPFAVSYDLVKNGEFVAGGNLILKETVADVFFPYNEGVRKIVVYDQGGSKKTEISGDQLQQIYSGVEYIEYDIQDDNAYSGIKKYFGIKSLAFVIAGFLFLLMLGGIGTHWRRKRKYGIYENEKNAQEKNKTDKFCPDCRTLITPEMAFCGKCGNKLR